MRYPLLYFTLSLYIYIGFQTLNPKRGQNTGQVGVASGQGVGEDARQSSVDLGFWGLGFRV